MADVTLKIGGRHYGGWTEIQMRHSLERAASAFELSMPDRVSVNARQESIQSSAWVDALHPVRTGVDCEVLIGDEKIITGYIDEVQPRYGAGEHTVSVRGRSKVADLIDCSLPPASVGEKSQFNKQTFMALATRLAGRFGIKVRNEAGDFDQVEPVRRMDPGQTVFEFLAERARILGVRLISDADGNLVVTRTGKTQIATPLELGQNILASNARFSLRNRFRHYYVVGQHETANGLSGLAATQVIGNTVDLQVEQQQRTTTIIAEGNVTLADAKRRAEWQRNVQYGRSRQITYTVSGWYHDEKNKALWKANHQVYVIDPYMGEVGTWWLIAGVEYLLDAQGERTELTLMPPEALELIPLPELDDQEKEFHW